MQGTILPSLPNDFLEGSFPAKTSWLMGWKNLYLICLGGCPVDGNVVVFCFRRWIMAAFQQIDFFQITNNAPLAGLRLCSSSFPCLTPAWCTIPNGQSSRQSRVRNVCIQRYDKWSFKAVTISAHRLMKLCFHGYLGKQVLSPGWTALLKGQSDELTEMPNVLPVGGYLCSSAEVSDQENFRNNFFDTIPQFWPFY